LCFSNGSPTTESFSKGHDESKLPLELLQEKLKTELQGINQDVIGEYFHKLQEQYKRSLENDEQNAGSKLSKISEVSTINNQDNTPVKESPFFRSVNREYHAIV
jgi:hypothetical protein